MASRHVSSILATTLLPTCLYSASPSPSPRTNQHYPNRKKKNHRFGCSLICPSLPLETAQSNARQKKKKILLRFVAKNGQALDNPHSPSLPCRAWRDAPVPLVCVGAGDGEPVEAGRRAVAGLLDPLLLHHPHGDGPRVPHLLDTDLVRAEAAIPRVAGAAKLQGSGLHLRQVRQGAAQEARPHQPPRQRQRQRHRRQEGERQGQVAVAFSQGEGERQEQVPLLCRSEEGP